MRRGGPELVAKGLPWPTGPQAILIAAAVGPDDQVISNFERWKSLVDLDEDLDGGVFRLLPLVFERLQSVGYTGQVMGRLKGVWRKSWIENQRLFHAIAPMVAALQAKGIKTMVIKGAPLALGYYKSLAGRPMMDLDIVVPADQADDAIGALRALGWTVGEIVGPHERADTHAIDLRNPDGFELDLHWRFLREAPADESDDWFWKAATPFEFCGAPTLQPTATQLLLHTIIHGVRSNVEPPIRWIIDAMMILSDSSRPIDWPAVAQFARRQKLTHRLYLGLNFLAQTYEAPVPAAVLADLKSTRVSLIERIENIVYLGDARVLYRPYLFPLIDYWRFLRNRSLIACLAGLIPYLQRRWRLDHPIDVPLAGLALLTRRIAMFRAAS